MTDRLSIPVLAAGVLLVIAGVSLAAFGGGSDRQARVSPSAGLTPGQLAGQRMVAGFEGRKPPGELRKAIRRGRIGGVILFADNLPDRAAARRLTRRLQAIPRPGALQRFPLLIMVDQEGGQVKRLPGAPAVSAASMGRRGPSFARRQGVLTGRNLRNVGINMDLAPVLDVARPGGDIFATDRAFGTTVGRVERTAIPFALGLESAGVASTAKHFPGLGTIRVNTDFAVQEVGLSRAALRRVDEAPYREFAKVGGDAVMVGTAIYPAFGRRPAAFNPRIVQGELRDRIGFDGVTITDALGTVAATAFGGPKKTTVVGARVGMDLLLFGDLAFPLKGQRALRDRLVAGQLNRAAFRTSVDRVLNLRARLDR